MFRCYTVSIIQVLVIFRTSNAAEHLRQLSSLLKFGTDYFLIKFFELVVDKVSLLWYHIWLSVFAMCDFIFINCQSIWYVFLKFNILKFKLIIVIACINYRIGVGMATTLFFEVNVDADVLWYSARTHRFTDTVGDDAMHVLGIAIFGLCVNILIFLCDFNLFTLLLIFI